MLKYMRRSVWGFILLVLFPALLAAQNFVYTNNDLTGPNSVSAFSVQDGSLIPIATYPTGGNGTASTSYSPNRIIVVKVKSSQNDFLYASNAGSNTISAFVIHSDGTLEQVGSPISTEGFNGTPSGISLAATPDGKYLYAGTTDGNITIYSVGPMTGVLTMVPSSVDFTNPFPVGRPMSSMKVSPNGRFLAVALFQANQVAMFSIQSDGALKTVSDSPFAANPGDIGTFIDGIDINCASDQLFAGRNGHDIDVFNIASTGVLSEPTSSPFSTSVSSNRVVVLSHPDDGTLFSSNPVNNTVASFAVGSDGSPTLIGSAPAAGTTGLTVFSGPGGLALSQDGAFLYAADKSVTGGFGAISTFDFSLSNPPTPPASPTAPIFDSLTYPIPNPFPTGQISGLQSLAAYPANECPAPTPPSNSLAVSSLEVSGGPPPAFELDALLTLEGSLGANPFLDQSMTIEVGDFALTLPAGSFKTFQDGRNVGTDLFQGVISGTTLKVQITPLGQNESGQNQFQIYALDKQVDLVGLDSSVTVTIKVGAEDNSPSASGSVTPTFPSSLRGNWRDF